MPKGATKEPTVFRLSLRELDQKENAKKKNDFLKAWKLIKDLPPSNPNSFWSIASYHGMPFKKRRVSLGGDEENSGKDKEPKTWGGYCQHGNVLFPFWHRLYCLRLEQALQSVLEEGNKRVALHYWDASSKESKSEGLPHIVTAEYVYIDGEYVSNPLLKFTIPVSIKDEVHTPGDDKHSKFYEKEDGYETCRYPYSGIRSPKAAKDVALKHNTMIDKMDVTAPSLLQANIVSWLVEGVKRDNGYGYGCGDAVSVAEQFKKCLDTADYNPFSNTSSACGADFSLEQPHNDLHLAIGGFTKPETNPDGSVKKDANGQLIYDGPINGANGDMGANEVASLDPVFFLHHSNIDRMFWVWQKKHNKKNASTLKIDTSDENDKGTSNSSQGATPNQTWGQKLNEDTILYPFQDEYGVPRSAKDCIDIVSQLNYDYSIGSLDQDTWPEPKKVETVFMVDKKKITDWKEYIIPKLKAERAHRIRILVDPKDVAPGFVSEMKTLAVPKRRFVQVTDINKDKISGSFLVQWFYRDAGKLYYLGQRGVLSRWNRGNCDNCKGRRMAHVSIPLREKDSTEYELQNLVVHLVHWNGKLGKYDRNIIVPCKDPRTKRSPDDQNPSVGFLDSYEKD